MAFSYEDLPEWFKWAFGGSGLTAASLFFQPVRAKAKSVVFGKKNSKKIEKKKFVGLEDAKNSARLLFIDDDTRYRMVKILKESGWINVEIKKDVNIDDPALVAADLVFVDIRGVGKKMGFQDEGLGLSNAIRHKYPKKYIVIYSSESNGSRFDEAFRKADDQLYKQADAYEFEKCIQNLLVI